MLSHSKPPPMQYALHSASAPATWPVSPPNYPTHPNRFLPPHTLPRLVAVAERVQGGLIGETLSRLGVAGLYTVVVLSISELEGGLECCLLGGAGYAAACSAESGVGVRHVALHMPSDAFKLPLPSWSAGRFLRLRWATGSSPG